MYPLSVVTAGYRNLFHWKNHLGLQAAPPQPVSGKSPKCLVVGWDAADWQYIQPLLAAGKLPALQSLIERGAHGQLASMRPMLSPMLWTTIATGKRPFAHGVHGFTEVNEKGETQAISGQSRTAAAFWDIFNHHNLRTQVVGWWPSHPAEPIDGQMVSNLFHHGEKPAEGFVYPKNLEADLLQCRIAPEWIPHEWVSMFLNNPGHPAEDAKTRSVMHILSRALSVQMAATYLLHRHETDVHAVYFDALDHFCHLGTREHQDEPGIVEAAYRVHDLMLEGILHYCDDTTNIVLLSDHGFQHKETMRVQLPEDPLTPELDHRFYGVLVTAGPGFIPRKPIYGAGIADIAPTLLQLFSIPTAKDMHGRVLHEHLRNPSETAPVDSYDHLRKRQKAWQISGDYLAHLEALGYLDRSNENQNEENKVNLARSYMDGLLPQQALETLRPLINDRTPLSTRMTFLQAALQSGELDTAKNQLAYFPDNWHPVFNAMLAAIEGRPRAVHSALKQLPENKNLSGNWLTLIGNLWLSIGDSHKALRYFVAALDKNPDAADAAFGRARALAAEEKWEDALEVALDLVEKQHFAPNVHELIGKLLLKLKQAEQAYIALKMSAQQQPKNAELRAFIRHHFQENNTEGKPVVVVSGLPRSGTSLMMQLLKSMGIDIHSDDQRLADEHNPSGYYEYAPVKRLHVDNHFLDDLGGKAIKITSPQLPNLSPGVTYKVILMQRPIEDVALSQLRMRHAESVPFDLYQSLEDTSTKALAFLENNQHWAPYIAVDFNKLLHRPKPVMQAICKFLGIEYGDEWKDVIKRKA
ncbi:MAG: alkaline phosphatase family protein [Cryomorphaceae bacterium]|nr:alkaline phosphatase family protein [Cryomorphaceae bacterium]